MRHQLAAGPALAAVVLVAVVATDPSAAAALTSRRVSLSGARPLRASATSLAGSLPPRVPAPTLERPPASSADEPAETTVALTVAVRGNFGALPVGQVTVKRNGEVIAVGELGLPVEVEASANLDVEVLVTSLVNLSPVVVRGVDLAGEAGEVSLPVDLDTGLVRADAQVSGRRVSGVVWFHPIDESGVAAEDPIGSIGANGRAREIRAGRYLAVMRYRGRTLSREVEIVPGATRMVRLFG